MERRSALLLGAAAALAGCMRPTTEAAPMGADGRPLPKLYRIPAGEESAISYRMLDGMNALRQPAGAPPLSFNAELIAAAATHARDMAVQNRPWHFGSDGSSPLVRAQRVGYRGKLVGELISETFQTELETLGDWSGRSDTRALMLNPMANQLGFAWFQETSGKIWWAALLGQG